MVSNAFWQWFNDYAVPKMDAGKISRSKTFRKAFEHLDKFKDPIIVETGCVHGPDKDSRGLREADLVELPKRDIPWPWTDSLMGDLCWAGHGCSTLLFDKYVSLNGGHVYSVDINPDRVKRARTLITPLVTEIHIGDSVEFLRNLTKTNAKSPHLVYLDSFDIEWNMQTESQVHHFNELQAIFPKLTTDTLVLVDDSPCIQDASGRHRISGKGGLIAEYANELQVPLAFSKYQTAWLGFPGTRQEYKPAAISYWAINVS